MSPEGIDPQEAVYGDTYTPSPNPTLRKEIEEILKEFKDEVKAGTEQRGRFVAIDQLEALLNQRIQEAVGYIKERREYFASKNLHSGWTGSESGPCCDYCKIDPKAIAKSGRAVALRTKVGCKNPFQIAEQYGRTLCQCHIPTRKAVRAGIVEAHDQLIRHFEASLNSAKEGDGSE